MQTASALPRVSSQAAIVPRLALMMFLQLFVWGSWYVTMGIVMGRYGMSAAIGDAYSLGPIASILSPFVLGMVVDRFFPSQKVLALLHIAGAVLLYCIPSAFAQGEGGRGLLLGLLFAYMLCYMPTIALTNNVAFHCLGARSEKYFPVVRVFGTLGWITAGLLVGFAGLSETTSIFTLASAASLALGLFSLSLPDTPAPAKGKPLALRDLVCADAFAALFRQRHFVVFAICATLISVPLAAYFAFAGPFLAANHIANVSGVMSVGQMSEFFFMLLIPLFFRRLGVKTMLLIGMCAWFLRYAMFAAGITESTRWLIYLGVALHGVCYDFFFVVGYMYTDKIAKPEIKGQAQGLVTLFTYGIGMLIGSQATGALFNRVVSAQGDAALPQWQALWWYPALAALVIAVVFFLSFHFREASTPASTNDSKNG